LVTNEDEEEQKEGYIDLDDFEMDKEGAAQVDEIPIWHTVSTTEAVVLG